MSLRLAPGLIVATLTALAILIGLGNWQMQRRAWKAALIEQVETRSAAAPIAFDAAVDRAAKGEAIEYQPVFLEGAYDETRAARVYGVKDGVAGVYLFTPLRRTAGPDVFVNRGFVPDAKQAEVGVVEGTVRVVGLLRAPQRRTVIENLVAAQDQPADNFYFARDPARFAGGAGAARFYVESDGGETDAAWPAPAVSRADFPNRHLEYALTWFGLAAALAGVFVSYSLKR